MKKAHLSKWRNEETGEYFPVLPDGSIDLSKKTADQASRNHGYNGYSTSESGNDQNSDMDLSLRGTRDYHRSTSSFEDTHHSTNFVRAHSHHSQTGALDLSVPNVLRDNAKHLTDLNGLTHGFSAFNGVRSQYMHYSGGVAQELTNNIRVTSPQEEATSLIDLSNSGKLYQLPKFKLEPGLGLVAEPQCLPYKGETDFNHNESYIHDTTTHPESYPSEDISTFPPVKSESAMFGHQPLTVSQDNLSDISCPASEYDSNTDSFGGHSKADDYSSQCRIPLTVTSADDDNDSGTESVDSKNSDKSIDKGHKKRPGRKKGQVSKVYHLWEFIRDVLADPNKNPTVIKWENEEEGIFRVVQSEVAASMWGNKKNNRTKMTYEKMSRSIRYSRKEGYFADIPRDKGYPKKLCFKFGLKAHGWRQAMSRTGSAN